MAKKSPAKKPSKPAAKPPKKAAVKTPPKALKAIKAQIKVKTIKTSAKSTKPTKAIKSPVIKSSVKKVSKPAPKSAAKPVAPKTPVKATPIKAAAPKAAKSAPAPAPVKKALAPVTSPSKAKAVPAKPAAVSNSSDRVLAQQFVRKPAASKATLTPFLIKQRQRLLELKDTLLDSMRGVARDNLHAGSETSAFGMHQADAGSDAYDRDFALSMLSKEQGSLYEIDEALKRIEEGSYGMCDISEKPIPHARLEALPFTRYTVECQAELEKRQHHHSVRPHINSLFGLTEEEAENEEEENLENS